MLRLTDTLTRDVVEIVPATPGLLTVYACGPTVYRYAHVGNLRTFVLTDLIARVGQRHGLRVDVVQNITDVGHMQDDSGLENTVEGEDKVLAQARAENKDPFALARFYEDAFHADLSAIGVRPAGAYPRASESIGLMLSLIGTLVGSGHAYVGGDGTVYFDARSFDGYGAISGNRLDELRPGHRFTDPVAQDVKRFHADWALWKHAGANRAMTWDSPWGRGFPGWHIECSAMSLDRLGETIDIHTGGIDLRFPHHEDERAQTEAAVGHPVVRHWVHGEHLLAEGRKMAKSTGNVVLVSDVVAQGLDPLAIRLFFLTGRYRQQMNLTWDALRAADKRLRRWRTRMAGWATAPGAPPAGDYVEKVRAAFDDDLDTPTALVVLGELEKDRVVPDGAKFETFALLDHLFGLDLAREVGAAPDAEPDLPAGAADLLEQRAAARSDKDYVTSDRLRDELTALGVTVADSPHGQSWTLD